MLGKDFFKTAARMSSSARELMGSMAGEVERLVKTRIEARLKGMNLVSREEFEALKTLAEKARTKAEALEQRLDELQGKEQQGKEQQKKPASTNSTKKKEPKA